MQSNSSSLPSAQTNEVFRGLGSSPDSTIAWFKVQGQLVRNAASEIAVHAFGFYAAERSKTEADRHLSTVERLALAEKYTRIALLEHDLAKRVVEARNLQGDTYVTQEMRIMEMALSEALGLYATLKVACENANKFPL